MTTKEFDIDVAMNIFAENKEIMDAAQCCAQLAANLGDARNAASFIREIAKEMAGEGFLVEQGGALATGGVWLRLLETQHELRWRMEVASLPEGYDAVSYTHLDVYKRQRQARELCNLSQSVAAKRLGYLTSAKLSKVEAAADTNSVPLWLIHRAASIYDVSTEFLFGFTDDFEVGSCLLYTSRCV